MGNVVVPLVVLAGGGALVYAGISNPQGGTFAGLGRMLRGEPAQRRTADPTAFASTIADLGAVTTSGLGTTTPTTPGGVVPTSTGDTSPVRAKVLTLASSWLGVPYAWGGNTKAGVDCSGLTVAVYKRVGVNLPRVSIAQSVTGRKVSAAQARPGDLVFFGTPVHHVGIYVGNGELLHAPRTGRVVCVEKVWSGERVTYRDVLGGARKPKPPKKTGSVMT